MTVLPRAATSPELVKLRGDNQASQLYLTVHTPATVYTARLAAVPSSNDQTASITYNTGSGTHTNIIADQTLWVGSAAGLRDYGETRIRNTTGIGATSGTFNLGEASEINWVSGAYLTVMDEFLLWPRHIKMAANGTTPLMDYDVAYTNENVAAGAIPTPIMGPHAVLWLPAGGGTTGTVSYSPLASSSWVKDGTISSYLWVATGASATSGLTTSNPTLTYDATGLYRIQCTVTGDNSVSFTGYRYIFVVNDSWGVATQFNLKSCAGDSSSGGWSFEVENYAEADTTSIRDRALVVLHARESYGGVEGSVGYVSGLEHVIAIGYIAGESIVWSSQDKAGSVSFTVQGPQYWLGKMTAFPSGVKDVSDATTPNKWTKFRGLTLNKAWYHFMRWRCTATRMMDVYPNTDTRRIKRLEAPGGQDIWQQLNTIADLSIKAKPLCDRYGRIFLEIEHQLVSDRSGMPTVQALTSGDWLDEIRFERVEVNNTSLVDMSGVTWSGTSVASMFSLANGHVFKRLGSVEVVDRLAVIDQATLNTQNGLYIAWKNNKYPKIDIKLAANHRLIDIAPYQKMTLAIASTDTPRAITESLTIFPRAINYEFDNRAGMLLTDATFEAEVTADLAVTGDTPAIAPQPPPGPIQGECPDGQRWDGTQCVDVAPIDPIQPNDASEVWMSTTTDIYYSSDFFLGGEPTWTAVTNLPTGVIRSMRVVKDGSLLYLCGGTYNTAAEKVWKCANPKAVTPTWTEILARGDALPDSKTAKQFFDFLLYGSSITMYVFTIEANWPVHGVYNGTSWSWTSLGNIDVNHNTHFPTAFIHGGNGSTTGVLKTLAGAAIGATWTKDFGAEHSPVWQNDSSGDRYVVISVGNIVKVFSATTGLVLTSTGVADGGNTESMDVRGAVNGVQTYFVDYVTGTLWSSADGTTFVNTFTWQAGLIGDGLLSGSGSLVWLATDVIANNEPIRISNDDGATWASMTGNFWSIASGSKTFVDLSLVYI